MKNKNTIVLLTIVITVLCLYYLSITFFSRGIQKDAIEYAQDEQGIVDQSKKQAYLDSIWLEPVLNILGAEFTYKDIKDIELNLGLDLQGGMHVTLEVSPVEIIRGLSGNNQDPNFLQALELANERQRNSQAAYTELFQDAYLEINPGGRLNRIFSNAANRGKISFESSNSEVMEVIETEVDLAIDRAFQILRTRVDRFGTSQPNIQRLQGTGRIQIELPGVDNPERVRKLLQGVAKLEFWEVYQTGEINATLSAINTELIEIEKAERETGVTDLTSELTAVEDEASTNPLEAQLEADDADSTAAEITDPGVSSFFALQQVGPFEGFYYNLADTGKINRALKYPSIERLIPQNLSFKWSVKAEEPSCFNYIL